MRAKIVMLTLVGFLVQANVAVAQKNMKNYGLNKKPRLSTTDFLKAANIKYVKGTDKTIVPILGAVIGAGISVYNTIHEAKQEEMTATYSNSFDLNYIPKSFDLQRVLLSDSVSHNKMMYHEDAVGASFHFEKDTSSVSTIFKLNSAQLTYAKACVTKTGKKSKLAISLDIKLSGYDSSGEETELGSATIIIPIIYLSTTPFDFSDARDYVPRAVFRAIPKDWKPNLKMSVTVKEVNLKVDPTLIEKILKSNGSDLADVIKAAIGDD